MQAFLAANFKHFEIFKDLRESDLLSLAKLCRKRTVLPGEQVFHAGEAPADVYFIFEGRVKVFLTPPPGRGQKVLFSILGPFQMFGELAAIDGLPRSAAVEAAELTTLAAVPADGFNEFMQSRPAFASAVMRQMASYVRRLSERVFEYSTLSVQLRVHSELLRYASAALNGGEEAVISPAPLRTDFAAMISTNREAVSRTLTLLEEDGILRRESNGSIRILDLERLRKLVADAKGIEQAL
jgi:CRP/FNR family transcriptional regulator, cyclic AMP receptor protein